ncbi:MAG: Uncharacterised protein [Methanobacteriota archaeon]|nr:MAG: Uncharacterised protein [Euryarchaeota archaeon]
MCLFGFIISLVPFIAIGTTGTSGYDADSLAIPVLPGNKKGGSSFFERVPSGKIPKALFFSKTSTARDNASVPPVSRLVSIIPVTFINVRRNIFLKCASFAR